jgi:aminoglycoside 3-N-acetyltransferase
MRMVTKKDIINELTKMRLKEGDNVLCHISLSSMGYVLGGAQTVCEALLEIVKDSGIVMMPTQSWRNLEPEEGVHWEASKEEWDIIRAEFPAYDKFKTPTSTMGVCAELFRTFPNAYRSDHPARSFAAIGKYAKYLTDNHDLSNIFGEGSPLSKLYDLNGKVLLIGVLHDKNTSIHLADVRANYESKHNVICHSAILENGKRVWKAYETLYVDGEDFISLGESFEKNNTISYGKIGDASIRLMNQRELVDYAVSWIEKNRK